MQTYSELPGSFGALVAPFSESIQQLAARLRQQIQELLPEAHEHVSGGHKIANVLYSLGRPNNVVCGLQPVADHCKLFLHHVQPGDVPGARLEGSGKYVRHVQVRTLAGAGIQPPCAARAGSRRCAPQVKPSTRRAHQSFYCGKRSARVSPLTWRFS